VLPFISALYLCHHHPQYTHQFDHQYDGESVERFWPKYETPAEGSEKQESEGADNVQAEVGFFVCPRINYCSSLSNSQRNGSRRRWWRREEETAQK
jgi:hypothetical protein